MQLRRTSLTVAVMVTVGAVGVSPAMATSRAGAPAAGSTTVKPGNPAPSYNGLALTPPMGWNDWSYYQCNISQQLILAQAKALVTSGLAKKGYDTVTVDDCWLASTRSSNGTLQASPTLFPKGMAWLGKQIHALGLKFGLYEDAGTQTCGGYPGVWGHEKQDADTFASWGVDYVKLDGCNVPVASGQSALAVYQKEYQTFSADLIATGRKMVFSDSMPAYFQGTSDWESSISDASKVANLWREGADTALGQESGDAKWDAIDYNYSYNVGLGKYAGPGHWNDPDFLLTGDSGLSTTEMQSQMSLWAEMSAPLISSTDLTKLTPQALAILGNKRIIAVDQDSLGVQGHIVQRGNNYNVLTKPLAGGDASVVLFNSGNTSQTISTTALTAGLTGAGPFTLTDLVSGRQTATNGQISAVVPAHGTVMYRVHRGTTGKLASAVSMAFANGALATGKKTPIKVTVTNNGPSAVNSGSVTLAGPTGWNITPTVGKIERLKPGASQTVTFAVSGATTPPPGPQTTSLTANVSYVSDGTRATIAGEDDIYSNRAYPSLASAFNNVGISDSSNYADGNFDGSNNSFSAELLAAAGAKPGATITSGGVNFTWPNAAAGTADNVQANGQTITLSGSGSALAFLGSGSAIDQPGTVTVTYTDGTTSSASVGFPNWSFENGTDMGATVAISTMGRYTPTGLADQAYAYRVFYNSIPLLAGKTVAKITLPSDSAIHVFAVGFTS